MMTMVLKGAFDTRRQAEMTIERMVQEHGIDRAAIEVAAIGAANSAGVERAGSDNPGAAPADVARNDGAHDGMVVVRVSLDSAAQAEIVRGAFAEFAASAVDEA
jgi:hypothetical protein